MALKRKIDKTAYEALSDVIKEFYTEKDGNFVLEVEDIDVDALRRAKDREKEGRKAAQAELDKLREQLAALEGDDARKRGDIEKIDNAWKAKLAKDTGNLNAKLSKQNAFIQKTLVDSVAASLASSLCTVPELMELHIKSRLGVDFSGDAPVTVILDAAGQPTKLTVADLASEIAGDKRFASVLKSDTKASGSDASRVPIPGSAGTSQKVDLNKLSGKEIGAMFAPKR